MFLVPNLTSLGMPCWFRHFSSTSDAWRLQIGLRSTEPPHLPVHFYLLLILHPNTDILNFGKFLLVRDLKRPTHLENPSQSAFYPHISAMTWLFYFNPVEKGKAWIISTSKNISTQKSAMMKYLELFYFNRLENISNFFLLWISKFSLIRLLIQPKLFRHSTLIGLMSAMVQILYLCYLHMN